MFLDVKEYDSALNEVIFYVIGCNMLSNVCVDECSQWIKQFIVLQHPLNC